MSENTAIAKINTTDFRTRVQDHIINTFGTLLPEEDFKKLVDEQIAEFFNSDTQLVIEKSDRYGYDTELVASVTPFQRMVWQQLTPLVKERLTAYMADDNVKNPINKLLDTLFSVPEFEKQQVLTAQDLLMKMAAAMMAHNLQMTKMEIKSSVSSALLKANMPEVANRIWEIP